MSWGERSCSRESPCGYNPTIETCNVDCDGYKWDGITEPDSKKKKIKLEITHIAGYHGRGRKPGWW